jgi:hypothetical protein
LPARRPEIARDTQSPDQPINVAEDLPLAPDRDLTDEEVVEKVCGWIRDQKPGALVRFGEGEGRLLVADINDEESLRVAANKVRRQAGMLIASADVFEIQELVTRALDGADIVGIRGDDSFKPEHAMWVRRIEEVYAERLPDAGPSRHVAHCLVNGRLKSELKSLLASKPNTTVVSSRDVKSTLEEDYGVAVRQFQVPSQYIMRNVDAEYESRLHDVPIWPDFIKGLRQELTVEEPGEVFLIGAGLFGKELCIHIRELGGIALDMGSTLDALAGKVTRGRRKPKPFPLPPKRRSSTAPAAAPKKMKAHGNFLPYLESVGWVNSYERHASVDADDNPIPWYRYTAIDFFAERTRPDQKVFEFGSGNSTLWWAKRVESVTAVEHNPDWARRISESSPENVEVMEVALESDGDYCRTPLRLGEEFNVLIIDGRDRVNCALNCLPALAPDGVIIWDDSHRRRYGHGIRFLESEGFRRIRFTGLGPISANPGETSILYRPQNCFQI